MQLIYKNDYGAVYRIFNSPNPDCEMQLVVDTVGLFMSRADLEHLLVIVRKSYEPCSCVECDGNPCEKIWSTNPLIDICLKVDRSILTMIEDLIKGTQFMINIDTTLEKYRLRPED
ncbi:hypothetical protein [Costertonia aggregata]|uniref:Uncharacterized protein n=1 Tax=Costertonia aggregata TaxID=343403 RepID=A0A7H9ASG6_9FLAO|nr:hypothetical protein [Costertonia aggregata]QLG46292.1 hypothetical protein HYG79_13365 [Costertonia aggregata]